MDGLIQYHAAIDPDVARTKLPSSPVPRWPRRGSNLRSRPVPQLGIMRT